MKAIVYIDKIKNKSVIVKYKIWNNIKLNIYKPSLKLWHICANKTIIIVKENQFNIDSSYIYN